MPPVGKIALLPAEIRDWLFTAFVERGFGSIEQITEELNLLMKEAGVAITIGKSAVGEASKRYKRAQESIAAVTRQMQAIADSAGDSGAKRAETQWCSDLGGMVQVSLIGFAVGGAFLSLSYFDLPYIMMSLVVLARVWVQTQGWLREPAEKPGWFKIPGLAQIAPKAAHKTTLSRP